jgi:hypothetical protein
MPVEMIGEFGTRGADSEWLEAEGKLAIRHVLEICGDPPPEMELEIVWQEHELGNYPTIGLVWDDPMRGAPSKYLSRCEEALTANGNGGELPHRWPNLSVAPEDDNEFADDYRNSETPQEPPALNAKEPNETKFADPEDVRRFLARAKRLLASSPERLREMPTTSKRIH